MGLLSSCDNYGDMLMINLYLGNYLYHIFTAHTYITPESRNLQEKNYQNKKESIFRKLKQNKVRFKYVY